MTPDSPIAVCRDCRLHYDEDWLINGRCPDCRGVYWRQGVAPEP